MTQSTKVRVNQQDIYQPDRTRGQVQVQHVEEGQTQMVTNRRFSSFNNPHSRFQTLRARWYPGIRLFPCSLMRCAGMLPVIVVLFIQILAYITAVPGTLLPLSSKLPITTTVLLVLFHFVFISTLLNYLLLVFTDPGFVPDDWKSPPPSTFYNQQQPQQQQQSTEENVQFPYAHLMNERTFEGYLRYCQVCQSYKPDRSHHCSVCKRCVLRMDHHCVFVNNCVSFYNHKFFISFVTYAFLGCAIISIISFPTFAEIISIPATISRISSSSLSSSSSSSSNLTTFHQHDNIYSNFLLNLPFSLIRRSSSNSFSLHRFSAAQHMSTILKTFVMIGYIVSSAFCFALGVFVALHFYLISKGRTTIEMYEMTDPVRAPFVAQYDLGIRQNFKHVCGSVFLCWFFPTRAYIEGDGIQYERRNSIRTANDMT